MLLCRRTLYCGAALRCSRHLAPPAAAAAATFGRRFHHTRHFALPPSDNGSSSSSSSSSSGGDNINSSILPPSQPPAPQPAAAAAARARPSFNDGVTWYCYTVLGLLFLIDLTPLGALLAAGADAPLKLAAFQALAFLLPTVAYARQQGWDLRGTFAVAAPSGRWAAVGGCGLLRGKGRGWIRVWWVGSLGGWLIAIL